MGHGGHGRQLWCVDFGSVPVSGLWVKALLPASGWQVLVGWRRLIALNCGGAILELLLQLRCLVLWLLLRCSILLTGRLVLSLWSTVLLAWLRLVVGLWALVSGVLGASGSFGEQFGM